MRNVYQRLINSLAFRLPTIYKKLVGLRRYQVDISLEAETRYTIVSFCGRDQLPMLDIGLKKLCGKMKKRPDIYVFTDDGLTRSASERKLKWLSGPGLIIRGRRESIQYHEDQQRTGLARFARTNPMGAKMAAIIQVLDQGIPVLYYDTDVLWFDDPAPLIYEHLNTESFDMAMSEDMQPAYDPDLIARAELSSLGRKPFYCAGVMLITPLSPAKKTQMNELLTQVREPGGHFTEQTIFAVLNRCAGDRILGKDRIVIKLDDQFDIMPRPLPKVVARHYIGPVRHLFWRDALWS